MSASAQPSRFTIPLTTPSPCPQSFLCACPPSCWAGPLCFSFSLVRSSQRPLRLCGERLSFLTLVSNFKSEISNRLRFHLCSSVVPKVSSFISNLKLHYFAAVYFLSLNGNNEISTGSYSSLIS